MSYEIERKFRVILDPEHWVGVEFTVLAAWEIWQAYLTLPRTDPEVRVRRQREIVEGSHETFDLTSFEAEHAEEASLCNLAIKSWAEPSEISLSRLEIEVPFPDSRFEEVWRLAAGRRLRKHRIDYMVNLPVGGHRVITVDKFMGALKGLILAEVEFGDQAASDQFEPPGFLGLEVTQDLRYRNAEARGCVTSPR